MTRTLTLTDDDPHIIDAACCPRCGGDVAPIKRLRHDGETYGFRVRHADRDASCSRRKWPVYDPTTHFGDGMVDNIPPARGRGMSVCWTCLSSYQHLGLPEGDDRTPEVLDPDRDANGRPICTLCQHRIDN